MPSDLHATKLIPDIASNDGFVSYVKNLLSKKIFRQSLKEDGKFQGAKFYNFGDSSIGYYALVDDAGELVYFVRYKAVKANNLKFGRQVLVWREKTNASSAGFAEFVFFSKLLPRFKALITDTQQTNNGRQFWQHVLRQSFGKESCRVYFLDRRSSPNTLTELLSYEEVIKYEPKIWGSDEGHLRTHAVISTTPLKIAS